MPSRYIGYVPFCKSIGTLSTTTFRSFLLCLAVALYALWGSPTPDDPGALEAVLGALLVCVVGFAGLCYALLFREDKPAPVLVGQVFLYMGLSVPVLAAILADNELHYALRDFTAFLFMLLPLFLWTHCQKDQRFYKALLFCVLALGLIFAIRTQVDVLYLGHNQSLYYLANMPTVLFAAIYFAGMGVERLTGPVCRFCLSRAALFFLLSHICLTPIIETQQRASVAAFALCVLVVVLKNVISAPKRSTLLLLILLGVAYINLPQLQPVFDSLMRKTQIVGANMRVQEWQAVLAEISGSPLSVMFGQGWGARFASPAVADINVNFTHGLLSSLLLKTGVFGMLLGAAYIMALLGSLKPYLKTHIVVVFAIAAPIAIDVFLYASFKSLDFGLVLALIPALLYAKGETSPMQNA